MQAMEYAAGNALGEELKRLRKERHLSQEEVAERLHIRRQTYSHYETGRRKPSAKCLCALMALYKIPMSELLRCMGVDQMEEDGALSSQEDELIGYYRKMDDRDREDILEYAKLKGERLRRKKLLWDE